MSDPWFWLWLFTAAVAIGCLAWALSAERGRLRAEVERDRVWDDAGSVAMFNESLALVEAEALCHCGAPVFVNDAIEPGFSRGMCEACDTVRCDAHPGACETWPVDDDPAALPPPGDFHPICSTHRTVEPECPRCRVGLVYEDGVIVGTRGDDDPPIGELVDYAGRVPMCRTHSLRLFLALCVQPITSAPMWRALAAMKACPKCVEEKR